MEIDFYLPSNWFDITDKTEVVLFGTRQEMEELKENYLFEIKIKPSLSARNLGFYMESQCKSQTHIAKICGTAHYTLKNVARMSNLLTPEVAKIVIQGLVISKLDKLQLVQNMGCRIIKNLREFDHITDAMKDLQWLKIPEHI